MIEAVNPSAILMARVIEILEECQEYFEGRASAEYFTDSASPCANEEMRRLVEVEEALRLARKVSV